MRIFVVCFKLTKALTQSRFFPFTLAHAMDEGIYILTYFSRTLLKSIYSSFAHCGLNFFPFTYKVYQSIFQPLKVSKQQFKKGTNIMTIIYLIEIKQHSFFFCSCELHEVHSSIETRGTLCPGKTDQSGNIVPSLVWKV